TSMRLEPEVWRALEDIAGFESQSINALCTLVHKLPRNGSLTSAMRTFTMLYYKEWVGHLMVGSGAVALARLDLLARTTRLLTDPML
ncbi:MAG: ribbon-helix-helix domain-containing protein, partial [Pseudomonadota bacterium]|nr:ribbon-helix-helix domain-containing protein [Pseudomonadota bacterium]